MIGWRKQLILSLGKQSENFKPVELYHSRFWQEINGLVIEVWVGLRKATREATRDGEIPRPGCIWKPLILLSQRSKNRNTEAR